MRQGGEESPLGQMGRGDDLGRMQHGGAGDARLVHDVEGRLHALEAIQPLSDQILQRAPVRAARVPGGEAGILGELRALHHREEPRPEIRGAHALQGEIAVADPVDEHARPWIAVLLTSIQHRREGDAVRGHEGLEHRHVEAGALSAAGATKERAQDRGGGVGGREHVGGLQVRGARVRLVALLEVHEPRDGVGDVGEGGAEPPGAALPESRDRAIDDVGLDLADGGVVAAEASGHAGREVLDEDVGVPGDVHDHRAPLGIGEIQRHALLAGVDAGEIGALVPAAGLELVHVVARLVAVARPLDLDDARPHVREQPGAVRAGQDTSEIQDEEARQGKRIVGHHAGLFPAAPNAL